MRRLYFACFVLAAACGSDNVHHLNDGGADAPKQPDGPAQPDAGPQPGVVTVTVSDAGSGISGVTVYFQNADFSPVAEAMTDGSGVASATMKPGGFVTVLHPSQVVTGGGTGAGLRGPQPLGSAVQVVENQLVFTFAGVKPGDHLLDDLDPVVTAPGDTDTFNITVPTDPNVAATQYVLFTTCASGSVSITPPVTLRKRAAPHAAIANNPPINITLSGCGGSADMLVETLDGSDDVLDTMFVTNVAVVDGSDVTLTGTYSAFGSEPIALTDAPPEFPSATVQQLVTTSRGFLFSPGSIGLDVSTGSGSGALSVPVLGSGALAVTTIDLSPQGSIIDEQALMTWGAFQSSFQADVGATHLRPWVTSPQVDSADELLSWSVSKTGAQPDFVMTDVSASRQNGGPNPDNWFWVVFAPGDQDGAIVFPTLPTDVFDFNFRDTDSTNLDFVAGAQAPGGYDAVRDTIILTAFEYLDQPTTLAVGSTGSVNVQELFQGGVAAGRSKSLSRRIRGNYKVVK